MGFTPIGAVVQALSSDPTLSGNPSAVPPVVGLLPPNSVFNGEMPEENRLPWVVVDNLGDVKKWVSAKCARVLQKFQLRVFAKAATTAGAPNPTHQILDACRAVLSGQDVPLASNCRQLWLLERDEGDRIDRKRADDDERVDDGTAVFELVYELNT
jgi:hypothetical protein